MALQSNADFCLLNGLLPVSSVCDLSFQFYLPNTASDITQTKQLRCYTANAAKPTAITRSIKMMQSGCKQNEV
jgi:hypothetical protein